MLHAVQEKKGEQWEVWDIPATYPSSKQPIASPEGIFTHLHLSVGFDPSLGSHCKGFLLFPQPVIIAFHSQFGTHSTLDSARVKNLSMNGMNAGASTPRAVLMPWEPMRKAKSH